MKGEIYKPCPKCGFLHLTTDEECPRCAKRAVKNEAEVIEKTAVEELPKTAIVEIVQEEAVVEKTAETVDEVTETVQEEPAETVKEAVETAEEPKAKKSDITISKKTLYSVVAVCLALILSISAVFSLRNKKPTVQAGNNDVNSSAESVTQSDISVTTGTTEKNATGETTTGKTTTNKVEENIKGTTKKTEPTTKKSFSSSNGVTSTTKKAVPSTTGKEKRKFNPTIEYPKGTIGLLDCCQFSETRYFIYTKITNCYLDRAEFGWDLRIQYQIVRITDATLNEDLNRFEEEDVKSMDKLPIKADISGQDFLVDFYTKDGKCYNRTRAATFNNIRNAKVGDKFEAECFLGEETNEEGQEFYDNVTKIVIDYHGLTIEA